MTTKHNTYLDLSKLSEEEIKMIPHILSKRNHEIYFLSRGYISDGKFDPYYPYLCFSRPSVNIWVDSRDFNDRTELNFSEWKAMMEGTSAENAQVENKFRPMTEFPPQVDGEHFSKTVIVFDEDLDDCDLGFYNFDTQKWDVLGGFQMNLICWRHIEKPTYEDVQEYPTVLTD